VSGPLGRRASVARRAVRALAAARSGAPPVPDAAPATTDVAVTFEWCRRQGVDTRPHYLWGTLLAARIGKALGLARVSVLELGVAGGNGLIALERAAEAAGALLGVGVDVYGFDSGTGMPPPTDERDAPWLIEPGWFAMDEPALRARLRRAELVLGPVAETVEAFARADPAPIGFVAFDLDYYSATRDALALLSGSAERLLPRVCCYFDDIFGYGWTDFTGERAAIDEFNAGHERRKIGKIHGLRYQLPPADHPLSWHEQLYLAHIFDHPRYRSSEGPLAEGWLTAHRLTS
jgi:hypothetical protein